jgi:hypothetical protein
MSVRNPSRREAGRSVAHAAVKTGICDVNAMRCGLLLLAMAMPLLGGCSGHLLASPPPVTTEGAPAPEELNCSAIARQRADDAIANGYDFDIEESVYRGTRDDCMSWRKRDGPK